MTGKVEQSIRIIRTVGWSCVQCIYLAVPHPVHMTIHEKKVTFPFGDSTIHTCIPGPGIRSFVTVCKRIGCFCVETDLPAGISRIKTGTWLTYIFQCPGFVPGGTPSGNITVQGIGNIMSILKLFAHA